MYKFDIHPAMAETIVTAKRIEDSIESDYAFSKLTFPDVSIPNRSLAWMLASKEELNSKLPDMYQQALNEKHTQTVDKMAPMQTHWGRFVMQQSKIS